MGVPLNSSSSHPLPLSKSWLSPPWISRDKRPAIRPLGRGCHRPSGPHPMSSLSSGDWNHKGRRVGPGGKQGRPAPGRSGGGAGSPDLHVWLPPELGSGRQRGLQLEAGGTAQPKEKMQVTRVILGGGGRAGRWAPRLCPQPGSSRAPSAPLQGGLGPGRSKRLPSSPRLVG